MISAGETRFPKRTRTLIAKAISVAIGIPQPFAPSPPLLIYVYIRAGTTIPPIAASIGSMATLIFESSPTNISRFISKPIIKKKIAIRPSLIQ